MRGQYNSYINTVNFQKKVFSSRLYFFGHLQKNYFLKRKNDLEVFYEELVTEILFLKNLLSIPQIENITIKLDKKKIKEISFFLLLKIDKEKLSSFLKLLYIFIGIRDKLNFNIRFLLYRKKLILKFQNLNQLLKFLDKSYLINFLNYTNFELKIESDF